MDLVKKYLVEIIVLIPPTIEVTKMNLDSIIAKESKELFDFAKCSALNGNPQADVSWKFIDFDQQLGKCMKLLSIPKSILSRQFFNEKLVKLIIRHKMYRNFFCV